MKIRNGFVSNSSSSSFIVAFPKKPKTVNDVLKYMFDGREGGVGLDYYDNGLSYNQVATRVFEDIKAGNAHKMNLELLIEAITGRYYYHANIGNCKSMNIGGSYDEHGGYWYYTLGKYFGSNKDLMEKLRLFYVEEETKEIEFREKRNKIMAKFNMNEARHAWEGGINPYTKKPYTKQDIKASEDYQKAIEKFRKTNKQYLSLEAEENKSRNDKWNKQNDLRIKIARCDAKNFLDDNKGYVFSVSYGDGNGEAEALMEHANVFRNVPHIKISNH